MAYVQEEPATLAGSHFRRKVRHRGWGSQKEIEELINTIQPQVIALSDHYFIHGINSSEYH